MALIIEHDGSYRVVNAPDSSLFGADGTVDLKSMQGIVGGWVEQLTFVNPVEIDGEVYNCLICNEEGKLQGLPINQSASLIIIGNGFNDFIVGHAILLKKGEIE